MRHQTITRDAHGALVGMDCPCGEDHGPSLREELEIERELNARRRAAVVGQTREALTAMRRQRDDSASNASPQRRFGSEAARQSAREDVR